LRHSTLCYFECHIFIGMSLKLSHLNIKMSREGRASISSKVREKQKKII
jgi:hypothetical protein